MEPYLLTQADIDKLLLADPSLKSYVDQNEMVVGTPATLHEQAYLENKIPLEEFKKGIVNFEKNLQPIVYPTQSQSQQVSNPQPVQPPANQPAAQTPTSIPANVAFRNDVNSFSPAMAQSQQGSSLLDPDPLANLSKNQRRLLAFAALKDAGMALQGINSNAVGGVLKSFDDRVDIIRKANAANQRREMLSSMLGGGVGPAGGSDTIEGIDAEIERLTNYAIMSADPAITSSIGLRIQNLQNKRQRMSMDQSRATDNIGAINTIDDMLNIVDNNPFWTTGFGGKIAGLFGGTDATVLAANETTIRSGLALDRLTKLKSDGATLGAVSNQELKLLESAIAALDPFMGAEAYKKQLRVIQDKYISFVNNYYADNKGTSAGDKIKAIAGNEPWFAENTQNQSSGNPPPSQNNPYNLD